MKDSPVSSQRAGDPCTSCLVEIQSRNDRLRPTHLDCSRPIGPLTAHAQAQAPVPAHSPVCCTTAVWRRKLSHSSVILDMSPACVHLGHGEFPRCLGQEWKLAYLWSRLSFSSSFRLWLVSRHASGALICIFWNTCPGRRSTCSMTWKGGGR